MSSRGAGSSCSGSSPAPAAALRGKRDGKRNFVRGPAAALVAAGACVSGVMCAGAAAPGRRPTPCHAALRADHHGDQPGQRRPRLPAGGDHRGRPRPAGPPTLIRFAVRGTITLSSPLPAVFSEHDHRRGVHPGYVRGGAPVVEVDGDGQAGLVFAPGSSADSCSASRWTAPAVTASRWRPAISPWTGTTWPRLLRRVAGQRRGRGFRCSFVAGERDRRE